MSPEAADGDMPNQNNQIDVPEVLGDIELFQTIESFDQAQAAFYDACTSYAQEQNTQNSKNIGLCGSLLARTFQNSVIYISETEPDPTRCLNAVANLMLSEDASRTKLFKELTNCQSFKPFSTEAGESMAESLQELFLECETKEEFFETVIASFGNGLQGELNHFLEDIGYPQAEDEIEPEAEPEMSLAVAIGKNLIDVAKIAGGVLIAGYILNKRKQA